MYSIHFLGIDKRNGATSGQPLHLNSATLSQAVMFLNTALKIMGVCVEETRREIVRELQEGRVWLHGYPVNGNQYELIIDRCPRPMVSREFNCDIRNGLVYNMHYRTLE